ncbi:MAG: HlyD family secretion protein [Nitrospirae bacterium]|nr:HlyD family secretion protein [Nitrospirota bacterium]
MKKIIIAASLLLIVTAGYFIFSKNKDDESKKDAPRITIKRYVAAEGKVEAMPGFEVEVGSEIDGRIAEFSVDEGDVVTKGQLIATLENRDLEAKLKEAEAELNVAKARLKEVASGAREEEIKQASAALAAAIADMEYAKASLRRCGELFNEGLISKDVYDEKEMAFKVAEARVKEAEEGERLLKKGPRQETLKLHEDAVISAEANVEYFKRLLEKTMITSPISGKVIRKYLQKGEMISKEMVTSLVAIADLEKVWINAEADETDIGRIKPGYPVEVRSDAYPGKVFKGEVAEISEYAGIRKVTPNDPAKNVDMKVIQVKTALKEKTPFKLGMTVDVKIIPQE